MKRSGEDKSRHDKRVAALVDGPLLTQGISCIDHGHYSIQEIPGCKDSDWDHTPDIYVRRKRPEKHWTEGIVHEVETEASVNDSSTRKQIQSWLDSSRVNKVVIHIPSKAIPEMVSNIEKWRGQHRRIEVRDWENKTHQRWDT